MSKGWSTPAIGVLVCFLATWGVAAETAVVSEAENVDAALDVDMVSNAPDLGWLAPGSLSVGALFSDGDNEFLAEGIVPFFSGSDSRIFGIVAGTFVNDEAQELTAGLVGRKLIREGDFIVGLHAMSDTLWTESDNRFDQVSGGVEILSRWFDARVTYYRPLTDAKLTSSSREIRVSERRESAGDYTTTTTSIFGYYEEALEGYQAEAGFWVPTCHVRTGLFLGYYAYSSDVRDDVSGMQARIESRIHPQLTLDAQWREDSVIDQGEWFAGVRVHLPLDFWNGAGLKRNRAGWQGMDPLWDRLDEPLHRNSRVKLLTAMSDGPIEVLVDDTLVDPRDPVPRVIIDGDGNPVVIYE